MGRQFPSAEGTGPTVRRPTGRRSGPRLSALRYPLMGMRRVRNRQFGTTVRRDAPRGNAAVWVNAWTEENDGEGGKGMTGKGMTGKNDDVEVCAPNSPPSCPALCRASTPSSLFQTRRGWPEQVRP